MFLLDTDTLIYNLKGHDAVRANLKRHLDGAIFISVVTLMELCYGAYKSQYTVGNLAKIKNLEQALGIIPVGAEIVDIFGMLKARLETQGARLDDFDLVIASCALSHNLTLVTNNTKHFSRIEGLKLANWTQRVH